MKKVIVTLTLVLVVLLAVTPALANDALMLFQQSFASMQVTNGVQCPLTLHEQGLQSGPGYEYTAIGPFTVADNVRCYCLARDSYGAAWVQVEFLAYQTSWRGYVPLDYFPASNVSYLLNALPWEASYDSLTPSMIAQLYDSCYGSRGPGSHYSEDVYLNSMTAEGTLIMQQGDWGLLELNEDTAAQLGLARKHRTWVRLSNCMY